MPKGPPNPNSQSSKSEASVNQATKTSCIAGYGGVMELGNSHYESGKYLRSYGQPQLKTNNLTYQVLGVEPPSTAYDPFSPLVQRT